MLIRVEKSSTLLPSVLLEGVLDSYSPNNIFFHTIISLDQAWQKLNEGGHLVLRYNNHTINGITKHQIARFDQSAVDIQWNLYCVRFRLSTCPNN